MADKKLRFEVEADTDAAEKDLATLEKKVEALEGEKVEVPVEVDTTGVAAQVADVKADLEKLAATDQTVKVKIDVDDAALRQAQGRIKGATDDIGKGAIQSVGPLRDVSAAFGNVGVGALDAAEGVLGFGESLATINPKFEKFFAIASRSAFVGGALAAGVIAASKALADFTGASTATEDALKTLELADTAAESMKALGKAIGSSAIQNGLRVIGSGGKDIEGFNDVLRESPVAALQLIKVLKEVGHNVEPLIGQYKDFVEETAKVGGESKKFAEDVKLVQQAQEAGIDTANLSIEAIARLMGQQDLQRQQQLGLNEAIAAGNEEMKAWAEEAAAKAADEASRLRGELEGVNAELGVMSGAILGQAEARVAAVAAEQEFLDLQKEGKATTDELTVAAIKLAEAHAAQEEAQAQANGETVNAETKQASLIESLKATAAQAKGPTKDAILAVVASLEAVPPTVDTTMTVNNAEALRKLNEQIRLMQIIRDTADSTVAALRAVPGGAGGDILSQAAPAGAVVQNITVNAGFGTDAFAVRSAVLSSARQAARLAQNAVRFR